MMNKREKIDWYRFGQKKGSYLSRSISFWYMIPGGYLQRIPFFGFKIRHYKYIDWVHYMDRKEMKKTFRVLLRKLFIAKNLKAFYCFAQNKLLEVKKNCDYLSKIIAPTTPNKQIARMFNYWAALKGWPDVIVPCGNFLVRTLSQETEKQAKKYFPNLSEQQIKEQLITLAYNNKETAFLRREKEILELAIKLNKYQNTPFKKLPFAGQRQIDFFNKKYGWMSVMFLIINPVSNQEIWKEIQILQRSNPTKKLLKLKAIKKMSLQARNKLLKTIKPDKDLLKILNLLRESSWVEAEIIKFFQMSSYYSLPFLNLVAERLHLTYNNLTNLGFQEIITALKTGILPNKKILAERKKSFGFYANTDKKEVKFLNAGEAKHFQEDQKRGNQKFIKGMTASPGKAKGRVRIILDVAQIPNFKSREILVTTMTTPNYIIAMKKAAAIVTNDGGITSHAAIIARELGKPCIIGTKIATKVLKNGDLVEVDANKGIVRKLK